MSTLPDYGDALAQALAGIGALGDEEIDVGLADGRVLREPITADRDLPPFNRAQMDGYAVRAADVGRVESFEVIGTISAGRDANVRVPPGSCVAIATGAPLPEDVDSVIQHELSDRGDRHGRPLQFTIDSITPGSNVHSRSADAKEGQILLESGIELLPHHLGIAATVGRSRLRISKQPRTVILTSGDEVLAASETVLPHQIRNSNQPMLASLLARMGAKVIAQLHLPDQLQPTLASVGESLRRADLLITVGGVSAGDRDHFPAAFDEHGVDRKLHGAAIQPGRPIFVGAKPQAALVVGLPGNPVSALACACLFAWPIVRAMLGRTSDLPWRAVQLAKPITPNPKRRQFRPAVVTGDRATVPQWAGSGDLVHTAPTHGLLELPVQCEEVPAGTSLRFLPWPG